MRFIRSLFLLLLLSPSTVDAQRIVARVVDSESRSPLSEVTVTLQRMDSTDVATSATRDDGFFLVTAPAAGEYRLRLERIGYATRVQRVTVAAGDVSLPAITLTQRAVPLEEVEAEARRIRPDTATGVGQRSSHLLAGERLARLALLGISGQGLVRELGGGLRVRSRGQGYCVESTRRTMSLSLNRPSCEWVAVIIDGVLVGDPSACTGSTRSTCFIAQFFRNLRAHEWESIEYLPPLQAGQRYGMIASGAGAIAVWTRGLGPYRSAARDTIH